MTGHIDRFTANRPSQAQIPRYASAPAATGALADPRRLTLPQGNPSFVRPWRRPEPAQPGVRVTRIHMGGTEPGEPVTLACVPRAGERVRLRSGVDWRDYIVRGVRHLPIGAAGPEVADVFLDPTPSTADVERVSKAVECVAKDTR